MSANLEPTTRMAVQGAVVALAGIIVSHLLPLERPYWIVLTGVVVINQTWGESVRRIVARVGMTALGCLAGWVLYQLSARSLLMQRALLLTCITLAVYFRAGMPARGYAGMVFFITLYIVFVFALVSGWTPGLVLARLYDTAIGCVLALVVSRLVLPRKAAHQLEDELAGFWEQCRQLFECAASLLLDPDRPRPDLLTARHELLTHLEQLHGQHQASTYESLGRDPERTRRDTLVCQAQRLSRYVLSFAGAVENSLGASAPPPLGEALRRMIEQVRTVLVVMVAEAATRQALSADAPARRAPASRESPRRYSGAGAPPPSPLRSRDDLLTFGPICYSLNRILAVLKEVLTDDYHQAQPADVAAGGSPAGWAGSAPNSERGDG